uniref:AMP-binding domain-containing protein n=2 Tax=Caenorhabditis japonica TaxID=281687 RepID=A0A8R1DFL9_CAEJA
MVMLKWQKLRFMIGYLALLLVTCVFVLTYDISEIIVASNLWVIDGFGYLSFSNKLNSDETLFTTSNCVIVQESRDLNRYVAHSNKSSFHLCFDFYNQLLDMLPNNLRHEWINHLIYNGFHNHEVLPYLFFILVRGDTCVLTQFTETNYNASLVDKIVGLVERYQPSSKEHLVDCGQSIHGMAIKIANIKTEKEAESGEWGQIILKGRQLFSNYLGLSRNEDRFGKHWYKTGDYGMIDENKVLHFQGPISKLITAQDKMVSSVLVETILSQNDMIEDAIVTKNNEELWCGLLLKNKNQRPTAKKLERILQKNEINLTFKKVMILDIIPNGNIEHNVLAYLHTDRHSIELEEAMVSCI